MTTFYLIRHGEKDPTETDPVITPRGHQQAEKTARFLQMFPITRIIASPKQRTQQTAAHIAAALSIPIITDIRLIERMDYGEGKYKDRTDFFTEWNIATLNRLFVPRAGSSSFQTGKRIQAVIDDQEDDQHIALVTHGGAIADFLRNVCEKEKLLPVSFEFPEGRDFRVTECSVTIVTKERDVFTLAKLHHTDHLI